MIETSVKEMIFDYYDNQKTFVIWGGKASDVIMLWNRYTDLATGSEISLDDNDILVNFLPLI